MGGVSLEDDGRMAKQEGKSISMAVVPGALLLHWYFQLELAAGLDHHSLVGRPSSPSPFARLLKLGCLFPVAA